MEYLKKHPQYVKLTKEAVREMFDVCNRRYFCGEVEPPDRIELTTPHRDILGLARPMLNRRTGECRSALHISRRFWWTYENLEKVVVHEMIHLYIKDYCRPLRWWERLMPFMVKGHDSEFISCMNQLNELYGLGIAVRFKAMSAYRR